MARLRVRSPFVAATAGGMIALCGDKVWLLYDQLLRPLGPGDGGAVVPHWAVYGFIGLTFAAGMALMAWSIVLYRRNGYASLEIRDELDHRRREQRRRRFAR